MLEKKNGWFENEKQMWNDVPNIISKCFYFCACFFSLSCSLSFPLFLFCFYWIGHSRYIIWYRFAKNRKILMTIKKNGDFFYSLFQFIRLKVQEKRVHSFENVKSMKCASLGVIFLGLILPKTVGTCQWIPIFVFVRHMPMQNTRYSNIYSVWHSKNAQFCFFLPPPLLLTRHPLAFFSAFFFLYVRSFWVSAWIPTAKQQHILHISPNCQWPIVPSICVRVFVVVLFLFCESRLHWPIVLSLIHSGRELLSLLIVTFIRIKSADCIRRIMFVERLSSGFVTSYFRKWQSIGNYPSSGTIPIEFEEKYFPFWHGLLLW